MRKPGPRPAGATLSNGLAGGAGGAAPPPPPAARGGRAPPPPPRPRPAPLWSGAASVPRPPPADRPWVLTDPDSHSPCGRRIVRRERASHAEMGRLCGGYEGGV